jgi:hypothetical protein
MREQRNKRHNILCTTSSKNAGLEEYMIESQEIKRSRLTRSNIEKKNDSSK